MSSFFKRASDIVEAKINNFLNRAENPNDTLDLSYEKMLSGLQETRRNMADVVTEQKSLEHQMEAAQLEIQHCDSDARMAVQVNRDDLAKAALAAKQAALQKLQMLQQAHDHIVQQSQKLIAYQKQLQDRINQFRVQKEVMKSQYSAAQAQVKVSESISGIGKNFDDVGDALQRAKDKSDKMQARADALDSLSDSGALPDPLDSRTQTERDLDNLRATAGVDDELAKLKASMAPKALGDGTEKPATSPAN
jgi:phage shock protein A